MNPLERDRKKHGDWCGMVGAKVVDVAPTSESSAAHMMVSLIQNVQIIPGEPPVEKNLLHWQGRSQKKYKYES